MKKIKVKQPKENLFKKIKMAILRTPKHKSIDKPKDCQLILHQNALTKALVYYLTTQQIHGDMEIMGWLMGKRHNDYIEIIDIHVGNCESTSMYTELDGLETIKAKKIAQKKGLDLLGNWHCHTFISSSPSMVDLSAMETLAKFGLKNPLMLIVTKKDFWLGTLYKGIMRKVKFEIPRKTDCELNLDDLTFVENQLKPFMIDDVMVKNDSPGIIGDCIDAYGEFLNDIRFTYDYLKYHIKKLVNGREINGKEKILETNQNQMVGSKENK